jgi:alkylhydroperoxidase family enzyme
MTTIRKRRLSPHPRRALELLEMIAISPCGATEALLVRAHGFTSDMITDLVSAGLATTEREATNAGAMPAEVVRVRITAAGQQALNR